MMKPLTKTQISWAEEGDIRRLKTAHSKNPLSRVVPLLATLAVPMWCLSGCSWLKTMVVTNKSSHAVCIAYQSHPKDEQKCVNLEPGEQTEFRFVSSSGGEFSMQRNEKAEPKVVVLPEGEPESKIVRRKVYAEYDGEKVTLIAPKRCFIF